MQAIRVHHLGGLDALNAIVVADDIAISREFMPSSLL
jgi:hypothetical protein